MEMMPRNLLWLTLRDTGWYESEYKGEPIWVRGYNIKRTDGEYVDVIVTAAAKEPSQIRPHLEWCASLALRSYQGCDCSKRGPCPSHARIKDIKVWGKCPDEHTKDGTSLRAWLDKLPARELESQYGIKVGS
jgi:hypothetical protein